MASAPSFDDAPPTPEVAEQVAQAARTQTGATHGLAVIVAIEDGEDRIDLGLDSLRRYLQGLPIREPNDFEKVDKP
ncbi:hypothetical protein C2W62_08825 [Candidatus Entotheonella serta]|nr:hypothetical protein C2W62_08825 [Candidatus Entotheonella serta]